MKTLAKKIIPLIISVGILLSMLTVSVYAAGSSIAFSKNKITVGETLTVTARFSTSSSDPMYGLEGYITYDPAVLEFVSSDNGNLLTNGKAKIVLQSPGKNNLTEVIKFKALKAGKSIISLESLLYVDKNDTEKSLSGSSATVTVTDPSAQASSNANLKGLTLSSGTLTPAFDPNVTSYSVTLPYNVTELWVSTSRADAKATATVEGSREMKVGFNKRTVIVTAENGATKTYTINITRLDESGNVPQTETQEPINDVTEVTVDGTSMYVQEDFAGATTPTGFSVIDYAFDSKTIPALSDGTYIMIYLKTPDGTASDFYVVNEDDSFTKLVTVTVGGISYSILPTAEVPDGYTQVSDFMIGEVMVPAYKSDNAVFTEFVTVYAKGPGGQNSFYNYDTVDGTMQRAVDIDLKSQAQFDENTAPEQELNIIETFNDLNTNGKIVTITILAIILLLIIAVIVLIVKIATAGKDKKEYEQEEDDFYFEDDESVGFEYVSVGEPVSQQAPEHSVEETVAEEEDTAQDEPDEAEENDEENPQDKSAAHDAKQEEEE